MGTLESHLTEIIENQLNANNFAVPLDYFSWGRDKRHVVDNTESLPTNPISKNIVKKIIGKIRSLLFQQTSKAGILSRFRKHYAAFEETYRLMSNQSSKNLFAELILMKLTSEKKMRLSSFTQEFINSYELASEKILNSNDKLPVYKWILRKVTLDQPSISWFTVPTVLNLHYSGRLYRYHQDDVTIEVEGGDTLLDAGVGWGDTTIYLASLANRKAGGKSFAFDILEEGMNALAEQMKLNPKVNNITPVLKALSAKDDEDVHITAPSPGARVVNKKTERTVKTISIDTFVERNQLDRVNFIKMDIEGAEVPALKGAAKTIKKFKPKLAISVYHKWDDLLVIPKLIHNIRGDYSYYLDCTTGFGGEAVLFCR